MFTGSWTKDLACSSKATKFVSVVQWWYNLLLRSLQQVSKQQMSLGYNFIYDDFAWDHLILKMNSSSFHIYYLLQPLIKCNRTIDSHFRILSINILSLSKCTLGIASKLHTPLFTFWSKIVFRPVRNPSIPHFTCLQHRFADKSAPLIL